MNKTNFDDYLEQQLLDAEFTMRFKQAGEAWESVIKGIVAGNIVPVSDILSGNNGRPL